MPFGENVLSYFKLNKQVEISIGKRNAMVETQDNQELVKMRMGVLKWRLSSIVGDTEGLPKQDSSAQLLFIRQSKQHQDIFSQVSRVVPVLTPG